MAPLKKVRCKWRARRISWCRKLKKFCDAPREYDTCQHYEPRETHHGTVTGKVRRNIRLLRGAVSEGIRPTESKYIFVIRTMRAPEGEIFRVVAKDATSAADKLAKELGMGTVELAAITVRVLEQKPEAKAYTQIYPLETKGSPQGAFPETLRLKPLFDMQDSLIEHKFPHEKAQIIDTVLSHAGDIYREMTHAWPDYGYVGEKWGRLTTYCARPPLSWLLANDWEEISEQLRDPSYRVQRDQFLSNLQRLWEETAKLPMDPKRKAVMLESLDMIKALIFWFESLNPNTPPMNELGKLTDAIATYFPKEFWRSTHSTNARASTSLAMSPTLELKSRFGSELRAMIEEAERQGQEIGAMICQLTGSGSHLSRACYGSRSTVNVANCHDGYPMGSFHVHLHGASNFSVPDLELAIRKEQLSCLGYMKSGVPMLKCITPKRYYEYPHEKRTEIKSSLVEAKRDIEQATQLFRGVPSPEAVALSQRAKSTLSNIEQLLGAYEVQLY